MKAYILVTVLVAGPALAQAEPHCSLPPPVPAAQSAAGLPNMETPPNLLAQDPRTYPSGAPAVRPASNNTLSAPESAATALPSALQHIVAAGAVVTDMGDYHGLRRAVARTGDEFMLLSTTSDGQAVVAGLMSDLSAADLSQVAGENLNELGTLHGLRGMLVKSGTQFQVFYATPDGQRVIPGVMWDAAGRNLTREQVAPIAGIVPTVTIGPAANTTAQNPPIPSSSAPQAAAPALNIVQATSFGTIGNPSAPRLWMFIDPLCSFSVRAMQQLQPFVASGRVQLAVIPLSVIDHETNGRSTANALAMLSKPADQMVTAWNRGDLGGAAVPEATARLQANMAAAQAIRLEGTPTLIWRKADGSEGRSDGLPGDLNAILASLGS